MTEAGDMMAEQDVPAVQAEPESQRLTVGERLAEARRQRDLSLEQVAAQLKWSARQIGEIEAGNYSVFPDMLTVRGFVRSYAKFLKVDSTPLLGELSGEFERLPPKVVDRPKLETPFPTGSLPWRHSRNPHRALAVALMLGLCLLAAFVYRAELLGAVHQWLPAKQEAPLVAPNNVPDTTTVVSQPEQVNVAPPTSAVPVAAPSQIDSAPSTPDSVAPPKAEVQPPVQKPAQQPVQTPAQPVQKSSDSVAKSSAEGQLLLSFTQDAWVQIKRHDGSTVISHLYRAGERETVAVDETLSVVVGNAPGVTATLRGHSLELPTQPGSNVANLSIK